MYYDSWLILKDVLCPLILFASISSIIISVLSYYISSTSFKNAIMISLMFSFFGATLGVLTGASREPSVNVVLPIIVSSTVGFFGYLTNKSASRELALLMPPGIMCFMINIIFAAFYGQVLRVQ